MEGLTEGRMVHYVMEEGHSKGEHRPAVVVKVWRVQDYGTGKVTDLPQPPQNGCSNLQVFTDGLNDGQEYTRGLAWKTSVLFSEGKEPGTWHWIEKA